MYIYKSPLTLMHNCIQNCIYEYNMLIYVTEREGARGN